METVIKMDKLPGVPDIEKFLVNENEYIASKKEQAPNSTDTIVTSSQPAGEIAEETPAATAPLADPAKAEQKAEPQETKPLSDNQRRQKVRAYIFMRDMGVSAGLALYSGDFDNRSELKLSDPEKKELEEAWMAYAHLFDKMPPYLDLLAAEATALLPKIMIAHKIRKAKKAVEQKISASASPVPKPSERIYFEIDENGFYKYPPARKKYLKEDLRTEKANVARDYENLVSENGKDLVHKVFNLS